VKKTATRFELAYHIDNARPAAETCGDGVFPLITYDGSLSELKILLAYKSQPALEKRFSHLKTDFQVAPAYLK
jgi:transposase